MAEIVVVCTANICRSPMAEVLLRTWVERHAPRVAGTLTISSAGVRARDGHGAAPHMIEIGDRWGVDLHEHRSRRVDPDLLGGADLVLTMEEDHRDAIARMVPDAAVRTFTLVEAVELAEHVRREGGSDPAGGGDLAALARRLHGARPRAWVGSPDVDDPYGRSAQDYEVTARELADLVERIAPLLATAAGAVEGSAR